MNDAFAIRFGKELISDVKSVLHEKESFASFVRNCVWKEVKNRQGEPAWLFPKRGRPRKKVALVSERNV